MKEGLEKYFEEGVENEAPIEAPVQELETEQPLEATQEVEQPAEENAPEVIEETTGTLETIVEETTVSQPETYLPEGVDKLVEFLNDNPRANLQDYLNLNKSFDEFDDKAIMKEYYTKTKPHLDADDVDFLLKRKFAEVGEEGDDSDSARSARIALKEELSNAKSYLNTAKEKYYTDLKGHDGIGNAQEETLKVQQAAAQHFLTETNKAFEGLDGFTFDVGDKRVRYKMENPQNVKEVQSNIENIVAPFIGDDGMINDVVGYHKAMFAARNADNLAKLFYEQGKADAIANAAQDSKNLDFSHTHRAPESNSKLKPGQAREIETPTNRQSVKLKYWKD